VNFLDSGNSWVALDEAGDGVIMSGQVTQKLGEFVGPLLGVKQALLSESLHMTSARGLGFSLHDTGFLERASQEQLFPDTQVETLKLLMNKPRKYQNVTSAMFYWSNNH